MSRTDDLERASTWLMDHGDDPEPLADLIAEVRAETLASVINALESDADMSTDPVRRRLVLHASILKGTAT